MRPSRKMKPYSLKTNFLIYSGYLINKQHVVGERYNTCLLKIEILYIFCQCNRQKINKQKCCLLCIPLINNEAEQISKLISCLLSVTYKNYTLTKKLVNLIHYIFVGYKEIFQLIYTE